MIASPFSLVIYDASCRIAWVSSLPAPHDADSFIGRFPWEFTEPAFADSVQAAMLRCIAGESPSIVDVRVPATGWWRNMFFLVPGMPVTRMIGMARRMPRGIELLTDREREICELFAEGMLAKQIAQRLGRSRSTVDNHRFHIAHKVGVPAFALQAWCAANKELICGHFPQ